MTLVEDQIQTPKADMVFLENISWEVYEKLVRDRDMSGQHFKIAYDRGRMVIMSPLPIHEQIIELLRQFVYIATMDRKIPRASYGSTTWKREDLLAGTEPDACYYLGREPDFDPHKRVDLHKHPAPDLAIEVNITHHPLERLELYAKLGVREVWQFDGKMVRFFRRNRMGNYREISTSKVLPFLPASDINRFIEMLRESGETATVLAFRDWLAALPK